MHDNGAAACSAESGFVGLGPTCSVKIPFLQRPPDNVSESSLDSSILGIPEIYPKLCIN